MAIQVERIVDMPAVLVTYDGLIKLEDILVMFDQTAENLADVEGHGYRISDFRAAESTFSDIVQIMGQARTDKPGSTSDPNLTTVFVGSNEWGLMVQKSFKQAQYGGKEIPLATTVEGAKEWIREDITKRTSS